MANLNELSQQNFDVTINGADTPVLVDFYPEDYAPFTEYQRTGQLGGFGAPVDVPARYDWSTPVDAYSVSAKLNYSDFELTYFRNQQRWVPGADGTLRRAAADSWPICGCRVST